jgi:hypothetical protein
MVFVSPFQGSTSALALTQGCAKSAPNQSGTAAGSSCDSALLLGISGKSDEDLLNTYVKGWELAMGDRRLFVFDAAGDISSDVLFIFFCFLCM